MNKLNQDVSVNTTAFIAGNPARAASHVQSTAICPRAGNEVSDVSTSELVINTEPTPDQVQYLEDRIYEFNSGATGITDGEWLAIFVNDERGRIVAGICGNTWGGCLEIRQFWVEEALRKHGLGTRLLGQRKKRLAGGAAGRCCS